MSESKKPAPTGAKSDTPAPTAPAKGAKLVVTVATGGKGGQGRGPLHIPFPGAKPTAIRGGKRLTLANLLARAQGATLAEIQEAIRAQYGEARAWDEATAVDGVRALCRDRGYGVWQEKVDGPIYLLAPERPDVEAVKRMRA